MSDETLVILADVADALTASKTRSFNRLRRWKLPSPVSSLRSATSGTTLRRSKRMHGAEATACPLHHS